MSAVRTRISLLALITLILLVVVYFLSPYFSKKCVRITAGTAEVTFRYSEEDSAGFAFVNQGNSSSPSILFHTDKGTALAILLDYGRPLEDILNSPVGPGYILGTFKTFPAAIASSTDINGRKWDDIIIPYANRQVSIYTNLGDLSESEQQFILSIVQSIRFRTLHSSNDRKIGTVEDCSLF